MSNEKIKVLIVDDSALLRAVLADIINSDPRLCVVAEAVDPIDARELIKLHNPDVLTLDIEMPKMNGIAFLKNLMRLRPMPVVMISTLTQQGAPAALEALECGAVDFLGKPKGQSDSALEHYRTQIVEKVYWASKANLARYSSVATPPEKIVTAHAGGKALKAGFICVIGASTGGTEAIKRVVQTLPSDAPPIVVTQHIPDVFSTSFAKRLNDGSDMTVYEAAHNQIVERGCVYLAPGHSHLRIVRVGGQYVCKLDKGELVNRHRPSVEVLMDSVLKAADHRALGVMLTGMGKDGSAALLRMREAGCTTVAQDEASSVVWGMPGAAVQMGAATKVLSLDKVARFILSQAY